MKSLNQPSSEKSRNSSYLHPICKSIIFLILKSIIVIFVFFNNFCLIVLHKYLFYTPLPNSHPYISCNLYILTFSLVCIVFSVSIPVSSLQNLSCVFIVTDNWEPHFHLIILLWEGMSSNILSINLPCNCHTKMWINT